jgi:hypothetical protein
VSWPPDGELADDEPLARPFLLHGASGPPGSPGPGATTDVHRHEHYDRLDSHDRPDRDEAGTAGAHHEVRPYLLTGGRTQARGAAVAMETIVLATGARAVRGPDAAGLERARILQLCERPCSAAEVAARLHLPLQVALVLVTDLVAEGLLDATAVATGQADDVLFLERLIAGVAAL